ncbi:PEP/pyruvate-binding domain-containing protein [Nocardiopsis sp. B62]|uniref:PEP/pyruvate-binding domain-containing protein n=1 Tax=Nocardiopsis sp. B62 TaxID=2824874 RepID=UPI001B379243|nr:PEP/pyruvate-binding domain-containing protein [Nocardiopsis sp. B62]MBQ1080002.1 pyruvate, water dikinase [Nocardiopsis sp. B62]
MGQQDDVVALEEIRRGMGALVGGKAANLGEMAAAGERVPAGFCVTTAAYASGTVPAERVARAYAALGGGRVAVRSSATAEDLPDASFAGQQDTYLDVEGADAVVDAVRRCWDSLDNERAVSYRRANGIDRADVRMAVVVQRMVDPATAGVMFTADPLTGSRARTVVDAVRGSGTAVVDGSVEPDHYALDDGRVPDLSEGCLTRGQVLELAATGRRLQALFGSPQDVEWSHDRDGTLWLLQSRPVTALFPLPPQDLPDQPRFYMEIGHMQGMLRPFTPLGLSMLQRVWTRWWSGRGSATDAADPDPLMVDVGSRLYVDLSAFLRSAPLRRRLPAGMEVYGPRVRAAVEHVLGDPRFAPRPGLPFSASTALRIAAVVLPSLVGVGYALARPRAARARAQAAVARLRALRGPGVEASPARRLDWVTGSAFDAMLGRDLREVIGPVFAGIVTATAPAALLHGVATKEETDTVLGGLPHNVTTEMDLDLWGIAERARAHGDLFASTPSEELAARYLRGELPDVGVDAFLDSYGHRAAGEVDIGVPRWSEDPAPVFGSVANYLRLEDPDLAPDRRFERAGAAAVTRLAELGSRAVHERPVRGAVAAFLMRRSRELGGMREYAKFAWLVPFAEMRRQLLLAGEGLVAQGLLAGADDVFFLRVHEIRAAAREGTDQRDLVAERRRFHQRELRRRSVPGTLLTDGTDVEAALPTPAVARGGLPGAPAAPGRAEGRARVVLDPVGARIEPGEILVAPTTDPGWTPLFMTAAGLVSETGSPIAHGPTVAREYGIPAVICVRDATTRIRTGDLLRVDGTAGTVDVVDEP